MATPAPAQLRSSFCKGVTFIWGQNGRCKLISGFPAGPCLPWLLGTNEQGCSFPPLSLTAVLGVGCTHGSILRLRGDTHHPENCKAIFGQISHFLASFFLVKTSFFIIVNTPEREIYVFPFNYILFPLLFNLASILTHLNGVYNKL